MDARIALKRDRLDYTNTHQLVGRARRVAMAS